MNKSGQHKHRKGQNLYRKSELSLYSGTEAHEAASCPSKGGKVHSIWWNEAPPSWCGAHLTAHLRPPLRGSAECGGFVIVILSLWVGPTWVVYSSLRGSAVCRVFVIVTCFHWVGPISWCKALQGGLQSMGACHCHLLSLGGRDLPHGVQLSEGVCRTWWEGLVIVTCSWCPSCYLCQKGWRFFCSDGYTTLWMYLLALNCAQKMVTMVNFVFCMAYYNKKECHFFETSPLAILCVCGQATKPEHLGRLGLLHLHTALGHLHQVYFQMWKVYLSSQTQDP